MARRMLIGLLALLLLTACGESDCEKLCKLRRDDLITNFNVAPEKVNCADPKWVGDCEHCVQVYRAEFNVQPELPDFCR